MSTSSTPTPGTAADTLYILHGHNQEHNKPITCLPPPADAKPSVLFFIVSRSSSLPKSVLAVQRHTSSLQTPPSVPSVMTPPSTSSTLRPQLFLQGKQKIHQQRSSQSPKTKSGHDKAILLLLAFVVTCSRRFSSSSPPSSAPSLPPSPRCSSGSQPQSDPSLP